jgi:hypothetical protein
VISQDWEKKRTLWYRENGILQTCYLLYMASLSNLPCYNLTTPSPKWSYSPLWPC